MQEPETTLETTSIDDFPLRTYEKLRYVDTDRQGHVNNAVFASMLETGRVELLYSPDRPLADPQCSFVIARLTLDLHAPIAVSPHLLRRPRAGQRVQPQRLEITVIAPEADVKRTKKKEKRTCRD